MNKNKTYYCDWRLQNICAYCGGFADTEDHVPSRCFLDKPHPENLPVVPCCEQCNKDFSHDEEYVSCLIDCMKEETTDITLLSREKTRKTLEHSPALLARIESQRQDFGGITIWHYEKPRFLKVFRKLAFGHLAYMNERVAIDSDFTVTMYLIHAMTAEQRTKFEKSYTSTFLPEVGSRMFAQVPIIIPQEESNKKIICSSSWQIIQEGRYRYCTNAKGDKVKIVIAEYLAIEVSVED